MDKTSPTTISLFTQTHSTPNVGHTAALKWLKKRGDGKSLPTVTDSCRSRGKTSWSSRNGVLIRGRTYRKTTSTGYRPREVRSVRLSKTLLRLKMILWIYVP